jgi:hypothetical protein
LSLNEGDGHFCFTANEKVNISMIWSCKYKFVHVHQFCSWELLVAPEHNVFAYMCVLINIYLAYGVGKDDVTEALTACKKVSMNNRNSCSQIHKKKELLKEIVP